MSEIISWHFSCLSVLSGMSCVSAYATHVFVWEPMWVCVVFAKTCVALTLVLKTDHTHSHWLLHKHTHTLHIHLHSHLHIITHLLHLHIHFYIISHIHTHGHTKIRKSLNINHVRLRLQTIRHNALFIQKCTHSRWYCNWLWPIITVESVNKMKWSKTWGTMSGCIKTVSFLPINWWNIHRTEKWKKKLRNLMLTLKTLHQW